MGDTQARRLALMKGCSTNTSSTPGACSDSDTGRKFCRYTDVFDPAHACPYQGPLKTVEFGGRLEPRYECLKRVI